MKMQIFQYLINSKFIQKIFYLIFLTIIFAILEKDIQL